MGLPVLAFALWVAAAGDEPQLVVLPLEAEGVKPQVGIDAWKAVVAEIGKSKSKLKVAVTLQKEIHDLLLGPAREQARDCGANLDCLREIGSALDAAQIVAGKVTAEEVSLVALEVSSGQRLGSAKSPANLASGKPEAKAKAAVSALVAAMLKAPKKKPGEAAVASAEDTKKGPKETPPIGGSAAAADARSAGSGEEKIAGNEKSAKGEKTAKGDPERGAKSDLKTDAKSDTKGAKAAKSDLEKGAKSDLKSDSKSDLKSDSRSDLKSDSKSDLRSDSKSDLKSDSKSDLKSDAKSDLKSDAKSDLKDDRPPAGGSGGGITIGKILVRSDQLDNIARLTVDGMPMTTEPDGSMTWAGGPGPHGLYAERRDGSRMTKDVTIVADQTTETRLDFPALTPTQGSGNKLTDTGKTPKRESDGEDVTNKWWFWTAIATAVVAGGATTVVLAGGLKGGPAVPSSYGSITGTY